MHDPYEDYYNELIKKVEKEGKIKVWVLYNISKQKIDSLKLQKGSNRIESVKRFNDDFVNRIQKKFDFGNIRKMRYRPAVTLMVDKEKLEYLINSEDVGYISEVKNSHLSLNSSTEYVRAPKTWDLGFSGKNQVIVIIDSGVDYEHDMFGDRVIDGACFSSEDPFHDGDLNGDYESLCPDRVEFMSGIEAGDDCVGTPGCDHGTHVAGIAAGSMLGLSGMAREAKIISINIFTKSNTEESCTDEDGDGIVNVPCITAFDDDIVQAFDYVFSQLINEDGYNISAINASFGRESNSADCTSGPLYDSIELLKYYNVNTVAASGNEPINNLELPACIEDVISVGSIKENDQLSGFSNTGEGLDLVAPGENIVSAVPGGSNTASFDGTSQAAPHVTGTIALMKEVLPTLNYQLIIDELRNTAYWREGSISGWGERPNNSYGYGLLDTYDSIIKILSVHDPNSLVPSDGEVYSNQVFEGKRIVNQDGFDLTINGTLTFKEDALGYNSKFIIAGTLNGDSNSEVRIIDDSELLLTSTGNFSFQPNLTKVIQTAVSFTEDKVFPSYYNLEIESGGKLYLSDGASLILDEGAELFLDKNTEIALAQTASRNNSISSPSTDGLAYKSNASSEGLAYKEIMESNIPTDFELSNNYPNPFNPTTSISYSVPEEKFVTLSIMNILGQRVATLVNEHKTAGSYTVHFDASNLSSGLYFYTLEVGTYRETKKMLLLK